MCGFIGFTGKLENKKAILNKMMDRIIHRGPDMAGDYLDDNIALGFRRLSIIDLSGAGRQPMTNSLENSGVEIVFNGEIYNFMELRSALEAAGHRFASETDTEVLIHGYEEWGEKLVCRLRGMFAFVIYDKKRDKLYGARDFFGIKPLYYTFISGDSGKREIIFGSEIKSFLEHPQFVKAVNEKALLPYLTFQYSAQEETFFKGVFKFPQAHYFTFEKGVFKSERYWDIDFKEQREDFDKTVHALDMVVNESVKAHRIADVKVGTFLSGGIDSSYITAAMMPDKTFSVGFDYNKFNETNYAAELSDILGINNYRRLLTADECFDAFPDIQYHMDEPQSNPSCVPLYFLAKLAREQVTVVLSGEGADEIFAGYEWYDETPMMRRYKKLPQGLRVFAANAARRLPYFKGHDFIIKSSGRPEDYFIGQALIFSEKEAKTMVTEKYSEAPSVRDITSKIYAKVAGKDELSKKQYLDLNLWMPGDILLKADKMSMAHSLELRVPFLDRRVMEFAQKLPSDYKINGVNTKYVLRRASARTLPEEWVNRPKKGFPVPIRYWLCEDKYYNIVKEYFTSDYAGEFFDRGRLCALLDDHRYNGVNNGRKIWTCFTFLTWYKRFFIDEK
ncbi:MAG: asparagine synthase (glutamine-hydrolyzing) [Eubacteriales bacterium]